ncbi:MAG: hypothetical protein ACP5G4_00385 [bacterium]
MKTKLVLIILSLTALVAFGGIVTGTVTYTGTETGMILVACIAEGDTAIDLEELTALAAIMAPGPYTINDASLVDGVNYYAVAFMGIGVPPLPESGNPAGVHPDPIVLSGGEASGADITIEATADVGGVITYDGDPSVITINVWDVYAEFTDSIPVLESTHYIGDTVYTLEDLPSGPKRIQAFEDLNGNEILDIDESYAYAQGPYGSMIIVGGGGVSDSGVDIDLPTTSVEENIARPDEFDILVSPNPFNAACRITAPGKIEILDMNGRLIRTLPSAGIWDGTDESGETVPAAVYMARATHDGVTKTTRLFLIK